MRIADPFSSRQRPVLFGNHGAVAAAHPLAVTAATEMLTAGGSAVDATIAAQAVLCVLSPDNCGLGGDQLCLVRSVDGQVMAVNGTGAAPAAMIRADTDGGNSVSVPGIVDAWVEMSRLWGRLPLQRVVVPAIRLAEGGMLVGEDLAQTFRHCEERLVRGGAQNWPLRSARAGTRQSQPELARLLADIGENGREAFYSGAMADAICGAIQRHCGAMAPSDLAGHASVVAPPLATNWRGRRLHVQPPISQGVLLSMVLAAEERLPDLAPELRDHVGIELTASSFAFRDRAGEGAALLSERLAVDIEKASGRIGPRAYLHTAGVAVADSDGLVVSSLISVFDSFGSAVFVPEGGFTLNNRAAGFTVAPNDSAGGKRPVHTLAPALLETTDGCLALATPGADGQVQTLTQVLSHMFAEDDDLATAIARPRWRSQDGKLLVECAHSYATQLKAKGHDVILTQDGDLRFGAVVCAGMRNGQPFSCADWRRETWAGAA
ncbi:gamma-glutamyltransferase [Ancylobacter mangrovi]|uniref:gamma-glutamyltransferase n=1 Tax=Ancylobacter mangrovi TaxID=2972472 RepID=UPI002163085E|nr:gamma-glutamyltransferase [Ancylobacter mangrovi]MCS0502956.1 gamma-glutamyltransferase [Ancylobacter mangrovi]